MVWCGARKGRTVASRPFPIPAALCTWVISSASSKLGGGRMPGRRRASMVLPAPGGPTISRLWTPAAAISSARLASSWPRTSARSGSPARASAGSGSAGRAGSGVERSADRSQVSTQRELAGKRIALELLDGHLSARGEEADRDRQVEARPRLAHVRGGEVDRQPLLRELQPGVEERRADALTRLAERAVRQPDEHERRESLAEVDLHGDLLRAHPLEGERGHCCEHPAIVSGRDACVGRGR